MTIILRKKCRKPEREFEDVDVNDVYGTYAYDGVDTMEMVDYNEDYGRIEGCDQIQDNNPYYEGVL